MNNLKLKESASTSNMLTSKNGLVLSIVTICVVLTLLYATQARDSQPNTPSAHISKAVQINGKALRLAIVPFRNDSQENSYLSDGISEELIYTLTGQSKLTVIGRQSSFAARNNTLNANQVGAELGAHYVLQGNLQRHSNTVKLTVRLFVGESDQQVWTQTYKSQFSDILAVQNQLAQDVAYQLGFELPNSSQRNNRRWGNQNIQAYEQYLLGRFHASQQTRSSLQRSIELFTKASQIDNQFAQAFWAIADSHMSQLEDQFADEDRLIAKAQKALDSALILWPQSAKAHTTQGKLFAKQGLHDKATAAYQKALSIKSNYAPAHLLLGVTYQDRHQYHKASEALYKAQQLDPQHLQVNRYYGRNLLSMGELEKGTEHLIKAINNDSLSAHIELELAHWYNQYGDIKKTREWAKVAYAKDPHFYDSNIAMALSLLSGNERNSWIEKAQQIRHNPKQSFPRLAQLYYNSADMEALRAHIQENLYLSADKLDSNKPTSWLMWAGIIKLYDHDYLKAVELLNTTLTAYYDTSDRALEQLTVVNLLTYGYQKLVNDEQVKRQLQQAKILQAYLQNKGLKTPSFILQTAAYYTTKDEHAKATQLLRNAKSKGWQLDRYINNNPIFEVLVH